MLSNVQLVWDYQMLLGCPAPDQQTRRIKKIWPYWPHGPNGPHGLLGPTTHGPMAHGPPWPRGPWAHGPWAHRLMGPMGPMGLMGSMGPMGPLGRQGPWGHGPPHAPLRPRHQKTTKPQSAYQFDAGVIARMPGASPKQTSPKSVLTRTTGSPDSAASCTLESIRLK